MLRISCSAFWKKFSWTAGIFASSFDRDPFVGAGLLGAEIACVLGGLILYLLFALVSTLLCPKEDAGD